MTYDILEHTADIRILIKGDSLEKLFKEALMAMMSILKNKFENKFKNHGIEITRNIFIKSVDRTALLVDFLNNVLAQSQINKEIYTRVNFINLSDNSLKAELRGLKVDKFKEDIKAVTYHEAEIRQNEKSEWETILIFDI